MVLEVYSSAKPAVAWRSWLGGALLLLGVSALAESTVVRRSSGLLSDVVQPAGWEVSFRHPHSFEPVSSEPKSSFEHESVMTFRRKDADGTAEIEVHRIEIEPGTKPLPICLQLLARESTDPRRMLGVLSMRPPTILHERLGTIEAVELADLELGMAVRATIVAPNLAYAFTLSIDPPHQDPRIYTLFDKTCASFEFNGASVAPLRD